MRTQTEELVFISKCLIEEAIPKKRKIKTYQDHILL